MINDTNWYLSGGVIINVAYTIAIQSDHNFIVHLACLILPLRGQHYACKLILEALRTYHHFSSPIVNKMETPSNRVY